jgi:hypothetical protein
MRPLAIYDFARAAAAFLAIVCAQPVHALYTAGSITAYQIPDGALNIDGRPDSLWRSLYARDFFTVLNLQDTSKMVILQPVQARNDNPAKYVKNPSPGTVTLMAAYDSKALYFYFLIKVRGFADPKAWGCDASNMWKSDAAEVFVDPLPWTEDPGTYRSYFTTDASGLVYGTSKTTIQVDKPVSNHETSYFYRDRTTAQRFQSPATLPTNVVVKSSPHLPADTTWVGVEMKIPFWTTTSSDFAPGRSMFVSWGFNQYVDSAKSGCARNPLAFRWAKNVLNYDAEPEQPPGWLLHDSTHYDPLRSWDGWGKLYLESGIMSNLCRNTDSKFDTDWDPTHWKSSCGYGTTRTQKSIRLDEAGMPVPMSRNFPRDALGRTGRSASPSFPLPD